MASLNIVSLNKCIDELRAVLVNSPLEVMAVNETRLDESIPDELFSVPGYNVIRIDRYRQGGGVAIYLKESIPFFSRHDLARADLEAVTVEISGSHSKPFLVTWYKPPSASVDIFNSFETLITKIEQEDKESIILGDFNCN